MWGHRFLSEANVTTRVKEIRRALGDDGVTQHIIRNVRGRGYRFVADVDVPSGFDARPPDRSGSGDRRRGPVWSNESALVTLIGPGGVGKSTLARAVADQLAHAHADGARLVELATLDEGTQVRPAVLGAVDILFDHERPALQSLAERDVLLVLDNCEHVVDEVVDLVDRVVATGTGRLRSARDQSGSARPGGRADRGGASTRPGGGARTVHRPGAQCRPDVDGRRRRLVRVWPRCWPGWTGCHWQSRWRPPGWDR